MNTMREAAAWGWRGLWLGALASVGAMVFSMGVFVVAFLIHKQASEPIGSVLYVLIIMVLSMPLATLVGGATGAGIGAGLGAVPWWRRRARFWGALLCAVVVLLVESQENWNNLGTPYQALVGLVGPILTYIAAGVWVAGRLAEGEGALGVLQRWWRRT